MSRRRLLIVTFSFLILLIVAICLWIFWPFSSMTHGTRVFVNPQNVSAAVGQDFSIDIKVSDVVDLYGWEFKLSWNNTILNLQNVTEGSFLRNTGATFFTYNLNSTGPHLVVDCTRLVDLPEASGSGTLSIITFHVQQTGICDLNLYDAVLINSLEQSMNCTAEGGHFT